jgi:hypothetical protein
LLLVFSLIVALGSRITMDDVILLEK